MQASGPVGRADKRQRYLHLWTCSQRYVLCEVNEGYLVGHSFRAMDMKWFVTIRKTLVGMIGGVVLVAGIAMIPLPGPAFVFIPLGLWILSLEFQWAKKLFTWGKQKIEERRKRKGLEGEGPKI